MTLITHPLDEKQRTIKSDTPRFKAPSDEEMREQMKTIINFNGKTFIELETKLKYEEIKRIALEMYKFVAIQRDEANKITTICWTKSTLQLCWEAAKAFYNFAKEKEKEVADDEI